jgi:hypothetical protein
MYLAMYYPPLSLSLLFLSAFLNSYSSRTSVTKKSELAKSVSHGYYPTMRINQRKERAAASAGWCLLLLLWRYISLSLYMYKDNVINV